MSKREAALVSLLAAGGVAVLFAILFIIDGLTPS